MKLELVVPPHLEGMVAEPVEIPAGQEQATLRLECIHSIGSFNQPVVLRATAIHAGDPVVAESTIELVPALADR